MTPPVRPRIGYLVPGFPAAGHAPHWREVRALEAEGVEVALLSTAPPAAQPHPWSAEARARTAYLGGPAPLAGLAALPALPWRDLAAGERGLAREALRALPLARRLAAEARRQGLFHVHVHGAGTAALAAALAERRGGPAYSLALDRPLLTQGPGQPLKWAGARFATVASRRLLAELRTVLREGAPARIAVQPLGVDLAAFARPGPYAPRRPGEPLRLFACGGLDAGEGPEDLLQAVRLLHGAGLDPRLAVAGEAGAERRAALEALAGRLGIGGRVAWLGAVGEAAVREGLLGAHLFVRASREEGVPVAAMEAMACAVPVVATAAGGMRELVEDGREGVLVPPRQPERLARALGALAEDPGRAIALAMAGRRRAEAALDARHGAATLMGLLGLRPWGDVLDDLPPLPR